MPAAIEWKPYYSVSEPSIDAQHQQIIRMINDLCQAIDRDDDRAVLRSVLDRLARYTATHFRHEEQILQEHGYPMLAEHKALHDEMQQRTIGLWSQIDQPTIHELLTFLKNWWLGHIQEEDKQYVPYLVTMPPVGAASAECPQGVAAEPSHG